jgi:hypothetical protein
VGRLPACACGCRIAGGLFPLFIITGTGCFVLTGWDGIETGSFGFFAISMAGTVFSRLKPFGSPDNWRGVALDQLRNVESIEGVWPTAPNHSRPASCVVEADVDAEDYHGGDGGDS